MKVLSVIIIGSIVTILSAVLIYYTMCRRNVNESEEPVLGEQLPTIHEEQAAQPEEPDPVSVDDVPMFTPLSKIVAARNRN